MYLVARVTMRQMPHIFKNCYQNQRGSFIHPDLAVTLIYYWRELSALHQSLVLDLSCVPEKVGVNQRLYGHKEKRFKEMEINQPKSIKLKMRGHKLESGVNLQGALKQNRHKTRSWCIWPAFM